MGKSRIQPGQVWLADLYGRESRVLVIASHHEVPEVWICEKLIAKEGHGAGPHILVNKKDFVKLEGSADEAGG